MINNGRQQGNDYGNRNHNDRREQHMNAVPYYEPIKSFYIVGSETKNLRPELFDGVAKNIALSFVDKNLINDRDKKPGKINSTQLRKIYDEVKRFEQLIKMSSNGWEKQRPYIRMIKSKLLYQAIRAKNKQNFDTGLKTAYDNLVAFLNEGIDLATDSNESPEEFFIFVSLFEAVYGYYYQYKPNKND